MYLPSLVLGALCLAICVMARPLGRAVGVLDRPDGTRKIHEAETPLVGGLAVIVPVVVMAAVLAITTEYRPFYGTLAASAAAFLVLGLIDDRSHTRPLYRLGASAALSIGVLIAVPAFEIEFLLFGFYPKLVVLEGWWALVFTVVCLVGLQNAVNMADGKNGLVIGLSLLWTVFLLFYAPAHLEPLLLVFAVCLCIALGFNLAGRLFLGDSGTYSISIFVGLLAIYCHSVGFSALRGISAWQEYRVRWRSRSRAWRWCGSYSPRPSALRHCGRRRRASSGAPGRDHAAPLEVAAQVCDRDSGTDLAPQEIQKYEHALAVAGGVEKPHRIAERSFAHAHLIARAKCALAFEIDQARLAFAGSDILDYRVGDDPRLRPHTNQIDDPGGRADQAPPRAREIGSDEEITRE